MPAGQDRRDPGAEIELRQHPAGPAEVSYEIELDDAPRARTARAGRIRRRPPRWPNCGGRSSLTTCAPWTASGARPPGMPGGTGIAPAITGCAPRSTWPDKPIVTPAVVTPPFRKLSADIVLRAYYAAGLGHPDRPGQRVTFGAPMGPRRRRVTRGRGPALRQGP